MIRNFSRSGLSCYEKTRQPRDPEPVLSEAKDLDDYIGVLRMTESKPRDPIASSPDGTVGGLRSRMTNTHAKYKGPLCYNHSRLSVGASRIVCPPRLGEAGRLSFIVSKNAKR